MEASNVDGRLAINATPNGTESINTHRRLVWRRHVFAESEYFDTGIHNSRLLTVSCPVDVAVESAPVHDVHIRSVCERERTDPVRHLYAKHLRAGRSVNEADMAKPDYRTAALP